LAGHMECSFGTLSGGQTYAEDESGHGVPASRCAQCRRRFGAGPNTDIDLTFAPAVEHSDDSVDALCSEGGISAGLKVDGCAPGDSDPNGPSQIRSGMSAWASKPVVVGAA
jgi:hypothetical protein